MASKTTVDFLLEQMERPSPDCYLTLFYDLIGMLDFLVVGTILGLTYVLGSSTQYFSSIMTQYLLISNLFKSGSQYSDYLNSLTEKTIFNKIVQSVVSIVSYKLGALTAAILLGIFAAKAAGAFVSLMLFSWYVSFCSSYTNNFSDIHVGTAFFFLAVTLPVVALFLIYTFVDFIFSAFINASGSTYLIWWFLDKNIGLIDNKEASVESLTRCLLDFDFFTLKFGVFLLFVAVSMLFQVFLYDPAVKVYYVLKTRGKKTARKTARKVSDVGSRIVLEIKGDKAVVSNQAHNGSNDDFKSYK